MPVRSEFIDFLRELSAPLGPVQVRRMFGGAGLYCDGVMFALIADDAVYLKANEDTSPPFAAEGLKPFTYHGKTKPVTMSYWRIPERLLDDGDEFAAWAEIALGVAKAGAKSKAKSKAKKKAVKPRRIKAATSKTKGIRDVRTDRKNNSS